MRRRRLLGASLIASILTACSAPKKIIEVIAGPTPTRIVGTLEASANLNPDRSKRASPLLVRVFELKSDAPFNNADFMTLFQRDQAELGAEIVLREEFMLQPGERRSLDRTAGDQTQFLAVFAAYRDVERSRWRALVPVKREATQRFTVKLDANAVSIVSAP